MRIGILLEIGMSIVDEIFSFSECKNIRINGAAALEKQIKKRFFNNNNIHKKKFKSISIKNKCFQKIIPREKLYNFKMKSKK